MSGTPVFVRVPDTFCQWGWISVGGSNPIYHEWLLPIEFQNDRKIFAQPRTGWSTAKNEYDIFITNVSWMTTDSNAPYSGSGNEYVVSRYMDGSMTDKALPLLLFAIGY